MHKTTLLIAVFAALPAAGQLAWKDLGNGRLEVTERGKAALIYNYGPQLPEGVPADRRRCCYIYPLLTPAGVSMLDDFPRDHYHHHGVFWAWPVVETPSGKFDLWMYRGVEHRFERWISRGNAGKSLELAVENAWYAAGKRIVKENVVITVHPSQASSRNVDAALRWEALDQPVTIRGSQEKKKSYGGFSARFAPRTGTVIRSSEGAVDKDEDLIAHRWAELEASYGGKKAILRITSTKSNPGVPYQWCLRDYGFVGASFPGKTETLNGFTIAPGKPLALKFTVTASDAH